MSHVRGTLSLAGELGFMCGIAGMLGGTWSDAEFDRLFAAIRHRGPDSSGHLKRNSLRLGMHRLQLRGESSPLPVTVGGSVAAFNGQVYAAKSPSGVSVPAGLEEEVSWVVGKPDAIDGMYACCFVEPPGNAIRLVTDPLSIKPLFYRTASDGIAFCSEMEALARLRPNVVDYRALAELFSYGWTLTDHTWLSGLRSVGRNSVVFSEGTLCESPKLPTEEFRGAPSAHAIRRALAQSVRYCLEGRGPFGLAVSGGLDSTILAWELNQAGVEGIVTLSLLLPGEKDGIESLDELNLPKGGAWTTWRHTTVRVDPGELLGSLTRAAVAFGQPTTMSSLPLSQLLADAAHEQGVRVLITGEGADELFGGYSSYAKIGAGVAPVDYYRNPPRENLARALFGQKVWAETRANFLRKYRAHGDLRAIELDLRLPRLLLRTDLTLMSRSVEGRTPFLHGGLPELALAIPWSEVCANGGKQVMRKAYAEDLGPRGTAKKTRFRLTDAVLNSFLRQERMAQRVQASLAKVFRAPAAARCMESLLSDAGFDADICCLVLTLTFLIESGLIA